MHFDMENGLAGALREFQSALTPTSAELVDLSQVPSYDWMRHVSVRNSSFVERQTSMSKQHSRKVSLVFNHLEPMQLAEHITYLEHKVIRRITVSSFGGRFAYLFVSVVLCLLLLYIYYYCLDFKLSPCSLCSMFSFGYFPGV